MQRLFKKPFQFQQHIIIVIAIAVVAMLGVYLLASSHAATPYVSTEAESGTLSGVTSQTDSTASGGSYVKFGTSSGGSSSYWTPSPTANWQWVLSGTFSTSSAADMGTGVTAYNGQPADPTIFDFDGILNSAATVNSLHTMGDKAVCYMEVGTQGDSAYYTAAEEGIATSYYDQLNAAGVLSPTKLADYADENFVNIASPTAVTILESEIKQQCGDKGFDAVETDLDDTYKGGANAGPYSITEAQEETFLETLSTYMHSIGLAWIAKDLDADDIGLVTTLQPYAQGMISEQTNAYSATSLWAPFETANKWIGDAEYVKDPGGGLEKNTAAFCPEDNAISAGDVNGILFTGNLDASLYEPCR